LKGVNDLQRSASCAIWRRRYGDIEQGANIAGATDRGVAERPVSPIQMERVRTTPESGCIAAMSHTGASGHKRRKADISRPGNKNCGCAHEVAGNDQQERMPAVAYRCTFGVASAF
jgi:hypothetical protein